MSDSSKPTGHKRPTTQSGGINVGDLASEQDINVTLDHVAGRDQIINSPGTQIINEAPRRLSTKARLAQRNRQTMILKVKAYWIDGVLANSLHSKIIPLNMENKPGAVTRPRPWDTLWQHRDQQPQLLPPGTRIIDRFNYAAGDALLILGEPGSGKTTMLLELAGELLEWVNQIEALRIPVVFNLSSWAVKRPPLTEWLVSELQTLYLIPKKVAQGWVEQDDILPLLDGLDEVAQEHRADCVKAINAYREVQGTPLVVCSRIADYEAIGEKLLLSDALLLRPLTPNQVNEYLAAGGAALDGVRLALQHDETLQEMAQSPLLLSIMALAYRDQPPEQFTVTNPDDRHLFDTYLQRQLPQRRRDEHEDSATTLRQLAYLAHQMTIRDQTVFLVERLQPDWLLTSSQQYRYRWIVWLVLGLVSMPGDEWDDIQPMEKVNWSWRRISRKDVLLGLLVALIGRFVGGLNVGFAAGLAVGLIVGLVGGLINEPVELKITLNQGIKDSAQNAIRVGLVFGLAVGLVSGLVGGLGVGLSLGLGVGLVFGLLIGGGKAVIKHYILRLYLRRYGYLPLNLAPFLDQAADRLILQKVGGGYKFVHRLLQEYLASLYTEEESR